MPYGDITAPLFVAEVKLQSPFGFTSSESWNCLFEVANTYGDWIGIHTHQRWGGSWGQLHYARNRTSKPILAKGLHNSAREVLLAKLFGASAVLTFNWVPPYWLQRWCWCEFSSWSQLSKVCVRKAVWNARDPRNGRSAHRRSFSAVREDYERWLCQASKIATPADVCPTADAFIVGEKLTNFVTYLV